MAKRKTKKKTKSKDLKLTDENLKNVLWKTIQGVLSGDIESGQAQAISSNAREIINVEKLRLRASEIKNDKKLIG